jgi:hypothetical protein
MLARVKEALLQRYGKKRGLFYASSLTIPRGPSLRVPLLEATVLFGNIFILFFVDEKKNG